VLAAIVEKATAFEPADRYPSAAAFGDAIRAWLDQRSAERIARSADERLDHLATALADASYTASPSADPARAQLERLASACRASIEDALALAPDLRLARDARVRYLELWVGHLIDRHDVDSARAELEDARGIAPELEARLARLASATAERMSRLHSLEQDLDLRPAARARKRFFVAAIVYGAGLFALAFGALPRLIPLEHHQKYSPIALAVVTNLVFWTVVFVARRHLLVNAASRHIMAWVGVLLAFLLVHRVMVAVFSGITIQRAFADEILTCAVMSTYATLAMSRHFWPAPLLLLAGYVCALVFPEHAPPIFGLTLIATLAVAVRVWGRSADR
jgi:hypothetical protein